MTKINQLAIVAFGLFTFHGQDFGLFSLTILAILTILSKRPQPEPCKIYDFMAEKAKRDARKLPISYKKAA